MRPEGVLVFGLLALLSLALAAGDWSRRLGHLALACASWAVPFTVYFAWRYRYFGQLLPNTFYAKTGGGRDQFERGLLTTAQFYWQFVTPLVPAVLLGAWEAAAGHGTPDPSAGALPGPRRHVLLLGAASITAVYSAYIVAVGNDYMAMHRFFVPVLPLIYLLAAASLTAVTGRVSGARAVVAAAVVVVAVAGTFMHSMPIERHFIAESTNQHGNYRGVQVARWNVDRLALIGRFFASYRLSSDESLATNGIGAIGYLADMRILDFNGLVDVHIARTPIGTGRRRLAGHQKTDYPYTIGLKPTYIMFGRDLLKRQGDLRGSAPRQAWDLAQADYVVRSVWLNDEANHESGYFTFLERRDHARPE
jgi:hypothetical protein